VLFGATISGGFAHTEGQITAPSEAQFQLYQRGHEAFKAGQYVEAVDLFKASLHLGELNITYLNLGRALFKLGDCVGARRAYEKALTAPAIAQPTSAEVAEKVASYEADLATCRAVLIVECSDPRTSITVGGLGPMACDGSPISLEPGQYTIEGRRGGVTLREQVHLRGMQEVVVEVDLSAKPSGLDLGTPRAPRATPELSGGLVLGGRVAGLVLGEMSRRVSMVDEMGSEAQTVLQTESSTVGLNVEALYAYHQLYMGVSGWFWPSIQSASPGVVTSVGGAEQVASRGLEDVSGLDLNLKLVYALRFSFLEYRLFVEGGLSFMGAPTNDPETFGEVGFSGSNIGGGIGLALIFEAFELSANMRPTFYRLDRVVEPDAQTRASDALSGTRILIDFGIAWRL
jgi:hypothetical protein